MLGPVILILPAGRTSVASGHLGAASRLGSHQHNGPYGGKFVVLFVFCVFVVVCLQQDCFKSTILRGCMYLMD